MFSIMAAETGSSNSRGHRMLCDDKALAVLTELCFDCELNPEKIFYLVRVLFETKTRFDEGSSITKDVLSKVSQLIANKKAPWAAVSLLTCLIDNSNQQLLINQCQAWMRYLCKIISAESSSPLMILSCRQIMKLITLSMDSNSLSRDVANEIIPLLLNTMLDKMSLEFNPICLDVILKCMSLYSGPCGKYASRINKLCLQQIVSNSSDRLKQKCCDCLSMMPFCESQGGVKLKFAERWMKYVELLKQNIDVLIGAMFNTGSDSISSVLILGITEVSVPFEQPERAMTMSHWFNALISILNQLLMKPVPSIVQLPLKSSIEIIAKLVNVIKLKTSCTYDNGIESTMLSIVAQKTSMLTLQLLKTIIQQCGTSVVLYSHLIFTTLLNVSHCTKSNTQEFHDHHSLIKTEFYHLLLSWLSNIGSIPKPYLQQILNISFLDIQIIAQKSEIPSHKKSKHVLSKSMQMDIEKSLSSSVIDCHVNSSVASLAWMLISAIINHTGPRIPSKLQDQIVTNAIQVAIQVLDCQSFQKTSKLLPPYGDNNCRLQLFQVLSSLSVLYHPTSPSPTPLIISLIKEGRLDKCPHISSHCRTSLISMDTYLKPVTNYVRSYDEYSIKKERKMNEKEKVDSAFITFPTETVVDTDKSELEEPTVISHQQTSVAATENDVHLESPISSVTANDDEITIDCVETTVSIPPTKKRSTDGEVSHQLSSKKGRTASPNNQSTALSTNSFDASEDIGTHTPQKPLENHKVITDNEVVKELPSPPKTAIDTNSQSLSLDVTSSAGNLFDLELNSNDAVLNDMLMTFVPAPPDSD